MARQEPKAGAGVSTGTDNSKIKETLDFLLHAYRAKLAVDNPSENCPFDFTEFLENWKDKYENWNELKAAIIRDVEPLANEGIFDSILPYLTASLNQSKGNKEYRKFGNSNQDSEPNALISAELTPLQNLILNESSSGGNADHSLPGGTKRQSSISKKQPSNEDVDPHFDPEIVIHVCDEAKCFKKDFYCPQSILVKEMGYFTKVTVKGQRLRDMDISVHCDISVFEWLMKWVKSNNGGYEQRPTLGMDPISVIGLMVSADFLQMTNLVPQCLEYTAENISQVINQSPNLGCLNESLTQKILHFFNNFEIETRINHIDKTDRITSRLYTQLIIALNDPEPDETLGHYASTSSLFKCNICNQLLINSVASKLPCCTVKCDCRGRIYATHIRDPNWSLGQFIRDLKKELKQWKKVYWRLWSVVHFFCCSHCEQYFSANDFASCRYHPGPATPTMVVVTHSKPAETDPNKANSSEQGTGSLTRRSGQQKEDGAKEQDGTTTDTILCPYGVYSCCKQSSYQFSTFPSPTGCEFGDHIVSHYADDDPALKLINAFRELIITQPLPKDKKILDWATLIDFTPQKLPSTSSTANIFSQRATASNAHGDIMQRRRLMHRNESSSTESNSLSDNEEMYPKPEETTLLNPRYSSLTDFWCWNPEYTTRYNQDMQREREEKLMADLEMLLAQRVSIDSGGSTAGFPSSIRLGYLSRRTQKNNGGSFLKLEEKWREEIQQSGSKSGKHAQKFPK